ncbi:MAG: BREX system P-loop protein BrxC [Vicinamibacterales bacterium]
MIIRDLFVSDVTRDIPPVVYFHEQSPEKLQAEVSEYIVTGGWPEGHPNRRRVPDGIHEQYVHLLKAIVSELNRQGGPDLPNAWISGFYGSGKSSFAKLLGLSLDGVALPGGMSFSEAWLNRDTSPRSAELKDAWRALRAKVDPIAVVFDIGGVARDNEHIHAAAVRQVQRKLGYCSTEPLVADFELRLERDGEWARFARTAADVLRAPWSVVKDRQLAEEDFSLVMSKMFPDKYTDPMSWFTSRGGTHTRSDSPEDAVKAIEDMLKFRRPSATLFLVVDEVSQYVLSNKDRVDRLRAFATALGAGLHGKAWLLALGQQKLEEESDDSFLVWAKDRFPPKLRVHLAATNIRDVVHKRLLQKRSDKEALLRTMFERHRPELKLYAYECESITADEFVDFYPMLPGQIELILKLTTALRARSARAQGDDQAIRGLLQLLGELFREQRLAEKPVGSIVTLDQIYEVQHTALDADVQASMARILSQCANEQNDLLVRAAKAVALLELIQDSVPTDARLVAQCLYDHVERGNNLAAVTNALEDLRRRALLGYSEKQGYKVQSTAGEEWDRERRDIGVSREVISDVVQAALKWLLAAPERPRLEGRPFPWAGVFSDGRRADDVALVDPREDAAVKVDFRFLARDERTESGWVKRSDEVALRDRLVWLAGDTDAVEQLGRELQRARTMVKKYEPRRESLSAARRLLLQQEQNNVEDLEKKVRDAVDAAWMAGTMYFRGRPIAPRDMGAAFSTALPVAATRILPDLFSRFDATQVLPAELLQLLEPELSGPSPKFMVETLGILELDAGRYVPACVGIIPQRIQEYIVASGGLSGTALLAHFGGPPFGYTANVVKACVAGLLRATRVRIQPDGGNEITAIRDAGVRDLFDKDREFKRATVFPGGADDIGPPARARICKFFEESLGLALDREDHAIADAVLRHFPTFAQQLRSVEGKLRQLPGAPQGPAVFRELGDALEQCIGICRQTKPTVKLVKKHLDVLRDGVQKIQMYDAELTPQAIRAVGDAYTTWTYQSSQLEALGVSASNVDAAATRIATQLESDRPWREISALQPDVDEIRAAYASERRQRLQGQERAAEAARARVRQRQGFSTLSADDAHQVLRPLEQALTSTDAEAVAPALADLDEPFQVRLRRAEDDANERLDAILSQANDTLITPVDLALQNRELSTEADVEALVNEIRTRLLEQIRGGSRVRLR